MRTSGGPRTWRSIVIGLTALATAWAVLPTAALADTVTNSVSASSPAVFEADAGTATVRYRVNANSIDGEAGCNAKPTSPMELRIAPPVGLTVTPASVTFTGCGDPNAKTVAYSATVPGFYLMTTAMFTAVDAGLGSYDLSNVGHQVFSYDLESYRPGTEGDPETSCTSSDPAVQPVDVFDAPLCVRVYAIPNSFGPVIFDLVPPAGSGAATQSFTVAVASSRAAVRDVRPPVCGLWTTKLYDSTRARLFDTDTWTLNGCQDGPTVTVPADVVVDTNDPAGAVATFGAATANDVFDGPITPTCSAASGDLFPVGTTTVTCSATDFHGNTGSASFSVTVDLYQLALAAPVDAPPLVNIGRAGRVVPVKAVVTKNGEPDLDGPVSLLVRGSSICSTADPDGIETYAAAGSSNEGNLFRLSDGAWIYNLDTSAPGMTAGRCYRVEVSLGGTVVDGRASGGHLAGWFLLKLR
jgi:hypothetical protein